MSTPRVIRAPHGTQLTCKNWLGEAMRNRESFDMKLKTFSPIGE
jgi:hypothetical protein